MNIQDLADFLGIHVEYNSLIGTAALFHVRMGPREGSEKGSYYFPVK
jgi:hypothetical protein